MTTFYLIRHGETEQNTRNSITGQLDIPLNDTGKEQAEKLAERLENEDFDAAYSSDLERTYETTRIVAEKHDLHPQEFEDFREQDFGVVEGKPKEVFRKLADESEKDRHFFTPEEGESTHEAGQRSLGKLEELTEKHAGEKILVGGHSVALKAVLMEILGLKRHYGKFNLDNTGITELEFSEEDGWSIVCVNDSAHLEQKFSP
ncbi:MAG: histidine phosphatase family protein [Candidatus Nanosalina sp.]